jgi:hypothetical protein
VTVLGNVDSSLNLYATNIDESNRKKGAGEKFSNNNSVLSKKASVFTNKASVRSNMDL